MVVISRQPLHLFSIVSNFEQSRLCPEDIIRLLFGYRESSEISIRIGVDHLPLRVASNTVTAEVAAQKQAATAVGGHNHSQPLDISRSVGHGDIFYSARRDSCVWLLLLVIRY